MPSARQPAESFASPRLLLSRRHCLSWATAGLAAPLLQACDGGAGAPPITPNSESVRWCREAIHAVLGQNGSPVTAISVALMADDRVVWHEAFGLADHACGLLATLDTRFNVGSISKVVTALAVMILRDRGQLALDQPLVELLPSFRMRSPAYTQITVRHLISHASGVPGSNYRNMFNYAPYSSYVQETLETLAQSHLKHEPGEMEVYCNDGFTLVDPLVRALTGVSFEDFVHREIFQPLGMGHSGYSRAPAAEGSFVHPFYEGRQLPQELSAASAVGGMLTTPTDLMKLARLFLDEGVYEGRRIVSADAVRQMGTNQNPRMLLNPTASSWFRGLGWDTVQELGLASAGLLAWEKPGGTPGFNADFFVLPEERLAMMIVGNGTADWLSMSQGLLLRVAKDRGAIHALPSGKVSPVPPPVSPAPDTAELPGVYASEQAPMQVVAASDGSLALNLWSAGKGWQPYREKLRARSDGYWRDDDPTHHCFRFQTDHGHRYLIARYLSPNQLFWREMVLGEWLPPLETPLPAAWRKRLGSTWECTNESSESFASVTGPTLGQLNEIKELPGYLLWSDQQLLRVTNDYEAGMTVKVPGERGRDLVELRVETAAGQDQLYAGSLAFKMVSISPG
ncbi:serine hydrolase domain-containing protein [Ottowia thiooxydans]|uniref:serine hydrolase domain-containing protein n=1 Tax=Ottowia thiooxydans TaxID=219182 RepID=UPI0003FA7C15|nr:serine hydrolase domain-containing protein [Ottowia thiooxydans]